MVSSHCLCLTTAPRRLPKRVLSRVRANASSLNFQYPVVSLRPYSSCFRLLRRLSVPSVSLCIVPSVTCFKRQFLRKMWPIQLAFLLYGGYPTHPWLYVVLPHFSHDRPNWSSPSFASATFQNFPGISHLLSEVSKFQHHTNLCFEYIMNEWNPSLHNFNVEFNFAVDCSYIKAVCWRIKVLYYVF